MRSEKLMSYRTTGGCFGRVCDSHFCTVGYRLKLALIFHNRHVVRVSPPWLLLFSAIMDRLYLFKLANGSNMTVETKRVAPAWLPRRMLNGF